MKKEVFEKSIVLVGPAGAGKSLLSHELSRRTGLPVVSLDLMRNCGENVVIIKLEKEHIESQISFLSHEREKGENTAEIDKRIDDLKNISGQCTGQIEMRKLLPNVQDYSAMGFDKSVAKYLHENFGPIASHFYVKQFENELLAAVVRQLETPVILDMGGGMAVSPDRDYEKLREQFLRLDAAKYREHFDEKKIGFKHIKKALKQFKTVVELKLPHDYKQSMVGERAANNPLNEAFISPGQYSEVATKSVDVSGLVKNGKVDENVKNKIVEEILFSTQKIKRKTRI